MAGIRESKRAATRERIAEAGLRLFLADGYDATTIDVIAGAAGISRRTFFYYFASKDDVLLAWHGAGAVSSRLATAMLGQDSALAPLEAALDCLAGLAEQYETEEARAMDALMQSSESLRARKDAAEARIELDLAAAMRDVWTGPERADGIRFAAMIAAGTLRLSLHDWRHDEAGASLRSCLDRNRRNLAVVLGDAASTMRAAQD